MTEIILHGETITPMGMVDVLDAIDMKLAEIEQTLSGNRVGRKNLMEKIESIRKLLEREKK